MTASFKTIRLANHRVLVDGTDVFGYQNRTVLDSTQWDGIQATLKKETLEDQFNRAVEEFYAPLIEKIDAIVAADEKSIVDDVYTLTVGETVEAVDAVAPAVYRLSQDSAILRLIQDGDVDRLVWVGDKLEIIAEEVETPAETPAETETPAKAETPATPAE